MKLIRLALFTCLAPLLFSTDLLAETGTMKGTVAETFDAGGYTYIRLEEPDTWIATSTLAVSEGARVEYSGGAEMKNFHSQSLDRTFESIWFVGDVRVSGQDSANAHHAATQEHASVPPLIKKPGTPAGPVPGEISLPEGATAIGDIFADPGSFNEVAVSVRAKVIKVSPQIMGKNWITLQDGSGTAPNDKLIAKSDEMAAVGEIVTAQGVIRTDVDLGYGYHYEALLEDTTFSARE